MMAQEIIVRPGKTLRFNLSIAKSFNADFDGDEIEYSFEQVDA
jgi:DNA-directed RNA polymerase beta' subunit